MPERMRWRNTLRIPESYDPDSGQESTDAASQFHLTEKDLENLAEEGFTVEQATGRTQEQLTAALTDWESVVNRTPPGADPDATEDPAQLQENTVQLSNEPWEDEEVKVEDWKSQLSPEELAMWEEFENTDWEAVVQDSESTAEEYQQMLEDMESMEGMEDENG